MSELIRQLIVSAATLHSILTTPAVNWVNCESHGNPFIIAPFVGTTQLDQSKVDDMANWATHQGLVPNSSDPSQQLNYSMDLLNSDGWHAWPTCGRIYLSQSIPQYRSR